MGCLCVVFRVLRGFDFDTGEGGHRGRQLESCDRGAHGGRAPWLVVFATGTADGVWSIGRRSWLFLVLSGLATGASWLFYFKALQIGEASKVIPVDKFSVVLGILMAFVFLHEAVTAKTLLGGALIAIGTFVLIL